MERCEEKEEGGEEVMEPEEEEKGVEAAVQERLCALSPGAIRARRHGLCVCVCV